MSSTAPSPMSPQRRRQILIIVAVVVVVLVVVAIALVSRLGSDSGTGSPAPVGSTSSTVPSPTAGGPSSAGTSPATSPATSSAASSSASDPVQTPAPTPSVSVPPPTATGKPTVVPTAKTSTTTVPLRKRAPTEAGVSAEVTKISSVKGTAEGPGEIAGPALRVTVTVRNGSADPVSLEQGLVNLYYGTDATPAQLLSGPGAVAFPSSVKAGATASGSFVFGVPTGERDTIAVEFSYSTKTPTVVFKGAA